jgi:acyl-CoA thioesterase I
MIPHVLRASLAAIAISALVSSCVGTQGGDANEAAAPETSAPEGPLTYVSLGDSLAVGVGASDPREKGYAPLYRDFLEEQTGREVRLVQLGISGETTESFIYAPESQLVRAEAALRENPGAAVTLSIGANDLLREADGTDADREAALARYAENLDHILRTLKGASDPAPEITALAIYNPAPGSFTDEWAGRLNGEVRAVARLNGVRVAAADLAFRGHEAEYSHYDQYSWDIHPTDAGYEALARAFATATQD